MSFKYSRPKPPVLLLSPVSLAERHFVEECGCPRRGSFTHGRQASSPDRWAIGESAEKLGREPVRAGLLCVPAT